MRRDDMMQMNRLLLHIRHDLEERGEDVETPKFDSHPMTNPKLPQFQKADQKEAMFALVDDLCNSLNETDSDGSESKPIPATAD